MKTRDRLSEVRKQAMETWLANARDYYDAPDIFNENRFDFMAHTLAQKCESPVEEMFAIALIVQYPFGGDDETEYFVQQWPIGKYRADFVLRFSDAGVMPGSRIAETPTQLVVEIDGHDFHERTKEQAKRDRSRDRDLMEAGYPVIRFTGSEVWADPFACAKEAHDLASTLYYERVIGKPLGVS